jgi:hypothetical protein
MVEEEMGEEENGEEETDLFWLWREFKKKKKKKNSNLDFLANPWLPKITTKKIKKIKRNQVKFFGRPGDDPWLPKITTQKILHTRS